MTMIRAWCVLIWCLTTTSLVAGDVVVTVLPRAAAPLTGRLAAWTPEALTLTTDRSHVIPAADLVRLSFPGQPVRFRAELTVVQTHGDRYVVTTPRIVDDLLIAGWADAALRPNLELPLETVAGLLGQLPPSAELLRRELGRLTRAPRGHDTLQLLTDDLLTGELSRLEGGLVEFDGALGPTSLELARLRRITLDPELATLTPTPEEHWRILLVDGSRITATTVTPKPDGTLQVVPLTGTPCFFAWHELSEVGHFTPKVQPLARRTPEVVEAVPYLAGEPTWRADQSIRRSPISLRAREALTGIGMTSRMALRYALEPGDAAFHALLGIDDAAEGRGAADFSVLLDDEPVATWRAVGGRDEPRETGWIELRGHRTLTLRVDYGPQGDAADFADWANAILVRAPESR